jgi:hypothetical protein
MKRTVIFTAIIFALFAADICAAQNSDTARTKNSEKPSLVVFVVGLKNTKIEDFFSSVISNELARKGNYEIIPRTAAIKDKLAELREYEDAGHIDDRELIEWGHQNNVSMLCVVQAVHLDEYVFSAQLIDVKSNSLLKSAEYAIPATTGDDLKKAASAIATKLRIKKL